MRCTTLLVVSCCGVLAACRDKADAVDSVDSAAGAHDSVPLDTALPSDCAEDADADGACAEDDCDDGDPAVYPGARESCDGRDEDCDGEIDEDAGATYYLDEDEDGYGAEAVTACEPPASYADNGADCDDTDPDIHPGAEERSNGLDDDCDGSTDEGIVVDAAPELRLTWTSSGLQVNITGGAGRYELGMAETGAGSSGWFGESCISGSEPYGYDDYGYDVCHSLSATGGFLTSVYPTVSSVADGATLFNKSLGESGDLTYVLLSVSSGDCWVTGHDVRYYDRLGCTAL